MTKYYTDEALEKLEGASADLQGRWMRLVQRCIDHQFRNAEAREFALHGFGRRMGSLVRCIDNTFSAIPPELDRVPSSDETEDAAIQVQSFIINVFGCLDNLAWVWVLEGNITKPNGGPIPQEWVGLRRQNTLVRTSFSEEFQIYLESICDWFDYLEDYRHALAHRIPLYIPQYAIDPRNEAGYNELEGRIRTLVMQRRFTEAKALENERDSLKFFRPFIMHSWTRQATPMAFHSQMLADFKTIEAIGEKVLDELAREFRQ
jgi:hypothetical protein